MGEKNAKVLRAQDRRFQVLAAVLVCLAWLAVMLFPIVVRS